MAEIRVGIGGWVFAPWRGTFYPPGLKQARELEYASSKLTSIEINGTFYGAQKPTSFQKWHEETPDDFVFSLKGPRFATYRKALGEGGPSIERFFASGVLELKDKLGPILWQLMPSARFDAENLENFLKLLPRESGGRTLRHVLDASDESFASPQALDLLRRYGVAAPLVDSDGRVRVDDVTADFVYARLRRTVEDEATGYTAADLKNWAKFFKDTKRDCFVYFIAGAKIRAPHAAQALIALL
jgi:uncharacterized protein YecE (DUF72 family)